MYATWMSLSVQNLTHTFSHGKYVLKDFSLEVGDGELVALVGPSGCGKTTLLHCIAGLISPASGVIQIDGEDVSSMKPHERRIGIMMQEQPLYEHVSVEKNIAFPLRACGSKNYDVSQILEELQLTKIAKQKVASCSGGERRRVAFGRAIVKKPTVLLLDEPFVSLNVELRETLKCCIQRAHADSNASTLFVTHDLDEAESFADRIISF